MEHTPGPWQIVKPKEGGCLDQTENRLIGTKINNQPYHIAETFQYRNAKFNTPDGVSLANARLIAASPDLLEACKAVQTELKYFRIMAAKDKQAESLIEIDKRISQVEAAIAKAEVQP